VSTFLDIQNEVLAYGFDATQYRARVKNWINEGQQQIARQLELFDLFTQTTVATVVGTTTYTLPTDFVRLDSVIDAALPNTLEVIPLADAIESNANGAYTGRPLFYAIGPAPNSIVLSPVPDAVYTLTLEYYKRPTDLSNDTDVSTLPADYHWLMTTYALQRAYRAEDDVQMAQFYTAEYKAGIQQLGTDRQYLADDSPRIIPGTWGVW
jgi:hypothetical protein